MYYTGHIDGTTMDYKKLARYGKAIIAFEISKKTKKPHFHFIIDVEKLENLKTHIRDTYIKKRGGTYSCTKVRMDELIQLENYVVKDMDVRYNDLLSQDYLKEVIARERKNQEIYERSKKKVTITYLEQMSNTFNELEFPLWEDKWNFVLKFVLSYTKEKFKMVDTLIIKRFCNTLYNRRWGLVNDSSFTQRMLTSLQYQS